MKKNTKEWAGLKKVLSQLEKNHGPPVKESATVSTEQKYSDRSSDLLTVILEEANKGLKEAAEWKEYLLPKLSSIPLKASFETLSSIKNSEKSENLIKNIEMINVVLTELHLEQSILKETESLIEHIEKTKGSTSNRMVYEINI